MKKILIYIFNYSHSIVPGGFDEIVFAEKGDLPLLGARMLEGLNLIVDSSRKKLVAAGPLPAA